MRLQRMIALASELSRRAAEEAIQRGEVTVNGNVVTVLGTTVSPAADAVCLKGKPLKVAVKGEYVVYHKPKGFLVTKSDPFGRPTIWDNLGDMKARLNAVGRLDFDTEGLIILTDDGEFLMKLTHPKHEVWKTYLARVNGKPSPNDIARLKNGIEISGVKTLPAGVRVVRLEEGNSLIEICIREGKNRQIRKMFDKIKCPVRHLRRIAIGPLKLGRLPAGKWRPLGPGELRKLYDLAK